MVEPKIAKKGSFAVDVEAGKNYSWCACGLSQKQPFCDGSHSGTGLKSVLYKAEKTQTVFFCGCKKTANQPLCDGTHSKIN